MPPKKIGPRLPSGAFTKMRKPRTKKTTTAIVKKVVNSMAESKMAIWYNVADTPGSGTPGTYATSGWSYKNQAINSNVTDIKRLLPQIAIGNDDNQRNGVQISPFSLITRGAVAVNTQEQLNTPNNIYVVIYVLQHVTYKSYAALNSGNDFTQLLNTGENTTVAFAGKQIQKDLLVDRSYYRLLKKKVIPLRYAGLTSFAASPTNTVASMANSHRYHANFTLNLSKKLPAVLKYPEVGNPNPNDPVNCSIFLCAGFYSMDDLLNTIIPVTNSTSMALTYTSALRYKDI